MIWKFNDHQLPRRLLISLLIITVASAIREISFGGFNVGNNVPYLLYYPAVTLAALYGGLPAGLLATAASAAVAFFWVERGSMSPVEGLALAFFILGGTFISFICRSTRRAHLHVLQLQKETEAFNQQLKREMVERQRAEVSQARLAAIVTFSEDAIISMDLAGLITSWNLGAEKIFGYRADEIMGASILRLIPPERQPEELGIMAQFASGIKVGHLETVRQNRDGRLMEVSITFSPILDSAGNRLGVSKVIRDITARKLAERRQRDMDELYRDLVANARDLIFILAPDGTFASVNPVVELISGFGEAHWLGQSFAPLVHPDDLPLAVERFQRVLRGDPVPPYELRGHPGLPKPVCMEITLFARKDDGGKIIGVMGMGRDITERQRVAGMLTLSEHKYRRLYETIADGIVSVDLSGRIQEFNPAFEQMLGYSDAELLRLTYEDLTPAKWHAYEAGIIREQILPRGYSGVYEKEYRRQDGTVFPVELRTLTIQDAAGHVTGMWASVRDITARKLAEEKIRKLSRAVEQSPVAIVITNLSGVIEYVNPKCVQDTGYSEAELLGGNPRIWKTSHTNPDIYRELWQTITAGREWKGEFQNQRKNGELYWEADSISPIRDASGRITHFLGIKEDITGRKQRETELEQARSAAEQANRAKSEFLAMMSHEIRTPMNAVLGMTSLLLETPLDMKQTTLVRTVAESGEALLAIINEILDFSKIESDQLFQPENQIFSLPVLLDGVIQLLRPRAAAAGIRLQAEFPPGLPAAVKSDDGRLRQVLLNLAGNGIKFTQKGGVTVRVRPLKSAAGRVQLRFEVADTGLGMTPEEISRLFEPFTQVGCGATRRYGGTGLGLAISKRIVELMGGRIGVESEPGRGSLFWFELEMEAVESLPASETGPVALDTEILYKNAAATGRPLRILVAEDHETNRQMMRYMLESLDCHADYAGNGLEAVAAWERSSHDLIFMDCQMPEMDGYTATGEIRRREAALQTPATARVRIIALTANALKGARERCLAAQMDDFLSKPFVLPQLKQILLRHVRPSPPAAVPSPGSVADRAVFDPVKLEQLAGDLGAENIREIARSLLGDLRQEIPRLQQLAAHGRRQEIATAAHSLKGITAMLGLDRLAALFGDLESATPDQQQNMAHATLGELALKSEAALNRWLDQHGK